MLWRGVPPAFRARVDSMVRHTLELLQLAREVERVVVVPLEGRFGDDAWVHWTHGQPSRVWLELEAGAFLTAAGREHAARRHWKVRNFPARRFSGRAFLGVVLHEFAHLRDEAHAGIRIQDVQLAARDNFNEIWNVWIDGRLRHAGHPALTRAARWRTFETRFRRYGRSRPELRAWFEVLWSAQRLEHQDLAHVLKCLGVPVRSAHSAAPSRRSHRRSGSPGFRA